MTTRRRPQRRVHHDARRVAFEVLKDVRESDAYANLVLPSRLRRTALAPADARLATELTYGSLRGRGFYDAVIAAAANRTVERIDPDVLDVLRIGTHQLLATRVPPHAAVDESVELVRRVGARSATGFVNGVLRRIGRMSPEEWREQVSAGRTGDDRLALRTSHPAWVVRAFRSALEREGRAEELDALLDADNRSPQVNLIALPHLGLPSVAELGVPNRFSPVGFTGERGDPLETIEHHQGRVRVQDEGSQLAALALTRARPVETGERWLDLCAGPGGKTALLAAEALRAGAELVANELVPARAELVRSALSAVPLTVRVRVGDGRELGEFEPGRFDRVLLDAPCSGLGALRRRPEARWRKQPSDIAQLTKLQGELLDSAVAAAKPGGLIAYVTCSPHLAETRAVVDAALDRHATTISLLDTPRVLSGVSSATLDLAGSGTTAQLWPHRHGTDAMFIALLQVAEGRVAA